jgi:hypothetical protein
MKGHIPFACVAHGGVVDAEDAEAVDVAIVAAAVTAAFSVESISPQQTHVTVAQCSHATEKAPRGGATAAAAEAEASPTTTLRSWYRSFEIKLSARSSSLVVLASSTSSSQWSQEEGLYPSEEGSVRSRSQEPHTGS